METNQYLSLSTEQLRRAAEIKEQLETLTAEFTSLLSGLNSVLSPQSPGKRRGRPPGSGSKSNSAQRLLSGAKSRDLGKDSALPATPGRRQMSPAARARIAAAAKARWAKAKAAGKNRL